MPQGCHGGRAEPQLASIAPRIRWPQRTEASQQPRTAAAMPASSRTDDEEWSIAVQHAVLLLLAPTLLMSEEPRCACISAAMLRSLPPVAAHRPMPRVCCSLRGLGSGGRSPRAREASRAKWRRMQAANREAHDLARNSHVDRAASASDATREQREKRARQPDKQHRLTAHPSALRQIPPSSRTRRTQRDRFLLFSFDR